MSKTNNKQQTTNNKQQTTNNKILNEILNFCQGCPSREICPERYCVLFRIEKLIEKNENDTKNAK